MPEIDTSYCPSCGASIQMSDNQGICIYCGTMVERQPAASSGDYPYFSVKKAPTQPQTPFKPTIQANTNPRRAARIWGIVASLFFVGIGVAIGLTLGRAGPSTSGPLSQPETRLTAAPIATAENGSAESDSLPLLKIGSISELMATLPRDSASDDLLAYVNISQPESSELALVDGSSRSLRWKSAPLSREAYQGLLVVGEDMIYLTDHEQLMALRLADGTLAWKAQLIAEPASGCTTCLRILKDNVLVMQKDGTLQSYDARSGQSGWSITLETAPRNLPTVNGQIILFMPTQSNSNYLSLIDPSTGKESQRIEPTCKTNSPSQSERLDDDAQLIFEPDGKTMYISYGFFERCLQRWDLGSGKMAWTMATDIAGHFNETLVQSSSAFFFRTDDSNEGGIARVDKASGKLQIIATKKKYQFEPIAAQDTMLLALTWPTWDTNKKTIVGIDLQSGEQRWEFKPQVADNRTGSSHGHWDWKMTPKGLMSLQVLEDKQQLLAELIDATSGMVSKRQTSMLEESGSQVFWDVLWSDQNAWLSIGGTTYHFDINTGRADYRID